MDDDDDAKASLWESSNTDGDCLRVLLLAVSARDVSVSILLDLAVDFLDEPSPKHAPKHPPAGNASTVHDVDIMMETSPRMIMVRVNMWIDWSV